MSFNFDTMNNTNEQFRDLSPEEEALKNEELVNNIPEIKEFKELDDEQKKERIEERRKKIDEMADKFGINLEEDIEEVEKELAEKSKEFTAMQEDLNAISVASLDSNAREGLEEMKNVLESVCGIYEKQLQIEYLQYIEEYEEDLKDPENSKLLFESHAERNLLMNNWEMLIEGIREDLDKTGQEEEETMRAWARWVKEHPKASLAILAALIVAGIAIATLFTPEIIATLPAIPGIPEGLLKEGVAVGAKMLGTGAGVVVGGGILGKALAWLSKEENRDKLAEGVLGAKLPAIAYIFNGRPNAQSSK